MSTFTDTQAALDTRLSTLSGLPTVAWENVKVDPALETTFIRPTLIPSGASMDTLDRNFEFTGIYSIEIYVEEEKGVEALNTLADSIFSHFDLNVLTAGSTKVFIYDINRLPATNIDGWFRGNMDIRYKIYT